MKTICDASLFIQGSSCYQHSRGAACMSKENPFRNMTTEDLTPTETKVTESGMVPIPPEIRNRVDIQSGDKLRWKVDKQCGLTVEVIPHRYGAFDDFEAVSMGGDGSETHDTAGNEG